MNPLSLETWEQGQSYEDYRRSVGRNGEVFDAVHEKPDYAPADLDLLRKLPPLRVLAIGEDWCPDVFHTLPTWARLVEELPGWELRVFARDSHQDLMRYFLWAKGAQRIPVYAFYDDAGRLQVWWSGRGAVAQKAMDDALAGRAFGELEADEKKRLGETLDQGYRERFRRANFEEIVALLRAFYHLG